MRKYISSVCVLFAAMLVAVAAQSCVGAPNGGVDDEPSSEPVQGLAYDGVWQIGDYRTSGVVVVHSGYFVAFDMPYEMIAARLLGGKEITDVAGSDGNDRLGYVATVTQDGAVVYTIKPKVLHMTATVDGRQRRVSMYLSPQTGSADDMSWGKLSKNGVMSIVLCVAQYAMDGGDVQTSSVKLTFTAMRK